MREAAGGVVKAHLDTPGHPLLDHAWDDEADDRHAGPELGDSSGCVAAVRHDDNNVGLGGCRQADGGRRSHLHSCMCQPTARKQCEPRYITSVTSGRQSWLDIACVWLAQAPST